MKKLLLILLVAIFAVTTFVSCKEPEPEHTHSFTEEVVDAKYLKSEASCTARAVYYKSCKCGEAGTETFEYGTTLAHSLTKTNATPASCTQSGNIDYWTCSSCNSIFSDASGEHAIAAVDTVIPASHELTHVAAKTETCEESGNIEYWTCSVCNKMYAEETAETELEDSEVFKAKLSHSMTKTDAVPATCFAAGNIEYWTCSICNKNYSDEEGTVVVEDVTINAGHVDSDSDGVCDNCGFDSANSRITVGSFDIFEKAFASAKANNVTSIVLTADIAWDQEKYPGSDSNGLQSAKALVVEADGLTLDLGTHSITGMVPQGLNIKGSNITIKNGSFLRDDTKFTDLSLNRYGLCVDYSTSSKATNQEYEENITLKDITTDAGVNLGYARNVLIENFTVSSDTYRPLCLCGTQDVVIKNSSITKTAGGTASDGALLVTQSGSATLDGTVSITNNVAGGTTAVYALYISGGKNATGASVTIADGAVVTISTVANIAKADTVFLSYGTSLIVNGTLNLAAGANISDKYPKGTGVFYFTGKDADSAGRSSVTVKGSLNITLPGEQDVIAFGNNDTGYYVVKFAQGSTLTLNGNPIDTITAAHCAPSDKVTSITSEEGSHGNRLTFIDLR